MDTEESTAISLGGIRIYDEDVSSILRETRAASIVYARSRIRVKEEEGEPSFSQDQVIEVLRTLSDSILDEREKTLAGDEARSSVAVYYPRIVADSDFGVPVLYGPKYEEATAISGQAKIQIKKKIEDSNYQMLIDWIKSVFETPGEIGAWFFLEKIVDNPEKAHEYVNTTAEELLQIPTSWKCIVFLNGLLCRSIYRVGGILVRPPQASDFKVYRIPMQNGTLTRPPFDSQKPPVYAVSSVLEFTANDIPRGYSHLYSENYNAILSCIEKEVETLRLSTGGRWRFTSWLAETDHVVSMSRIDTRYPVERYLRELGMLSYSSFGEKEYSVYQHVRTKAIPQYFRKKKWPGPGRAMSMLHEASLRRPVEAILFSTIGLETLLLGYETELRLRLAIRTASLLECLGLSRSDVFDDIYKAYKIRSDFVHGNEVSDEAAGNIAQKMQEHLRLSILMWLEIRSKSEEKRIRKKLDRASMQDDDRQDLLKRFSHSREVYKDLVTAK